MSPDTQISIEMLVPGPGGLEPLVGTNGLPVHKVYEQLGNRVCIAGYTEGPPSEDFSEMGTHTGDSRKSFGIWAASYRGFADSPTQVRAHREMIDAIVEDLRSRAPEDRYTIVDAGMGAGVFIERLINRFSTCGIGEDQYSIAGFDLTDEMVVKARQHLNACFGGNQIALSTGDVADFPEEFGDESVDLVAANLVLHHLPDSTSPYEQFDKADGVEEIKRVLKPGGMLLLSDWDVDASFDDESQRGRYPYGGFERLARINRACSGLVEQTAKHADIATVIRLDKGSRLDTIQGQREFLWSRSQWEQLLESKGFTTKRGWRDPLSTFNLLLARKEK